MTIKQLIKIYVVKNNRHLVKIRSDASSFDGFACNDIDLDHWKKNQTWRIPPIVLDVNSLNQIPTYADIKGPYQLIEGHSRLGYLLAMQQTGFLKKMEHHVYLLSQK